MVHTNRPRSILRRRASRWGVAALSLLLIACDNNRDIKHALDPLFPETPSSAVHDAFNVYDPDERRKGIALLSAAPFGGEASYVRLYRLLLDDPDATVRASAIKALGDHGTVDDAKLIIARLVIKGEDAPFVRWECAKALQKIHNPVAIQPLIDAVKDDDVDVRMAAAYALGQYAEPRVVSVLEGALDDQEFGVVEAAHVSLKTLTGEDFGTDGTAWHQWVEANRNQMFKNQQTYVWQPYVQPRSFIQKVQFWKKNKKVEPQIPTGMEATSATQPAPQS